MIRQFLDDQRGAVTAGQVGPLAGATLRRDAWWMETAAVIAGLAAFVAYATWRAFMNAHYYVPPYVSPFYSPCVAQVCEHATVRLIGGWWRFTPSLLVLWVPLGFRVTCYYARRVYYRSLFWAPPACAVRDRPAEYAGETRFPWILQNLHRYFFWLILLIVVVHWWDVALAFRFPGGFGIGLGTLIILVDAALLSLYTFSCHACRHLCGGHVDAFSRAPARSRLWSLVSRLNPYHGTFFWAALGWVALADLYIYLLSLGVLHDVRFV